MEGDSKNKNRLSKSISARISFLKRKISVAFLIGIIFPLISMGYLLHDPVFHTFHKPCIHLTESSAPLFSIAGENRTVESYLYAYYGDLELTFDQPTGGLLHYVANIRNSGRGQAIDVEIHLEMPGVPLVIYSNRLNTEIEGREAGATVADYERFYDARLFITTEKQDAVNFNQVKKHYSPSVLIEPAPRLFMEDSSFVANNTRYFVGGFYPDWFSFVTYVQGDGRLTLKVGNIPPNGEWIIDIFYFGTRYDLESAGFLTTSWIGTGNIIQTQQRVLTAFDAGTQSQQAASYGARPWQGGVDPMCDWSVDWWP